MALESTQATLAFLLSCAFKELFASRRQLVIEHSIADGYFCHAADGKPFTSAEIKQLEARLIHFVENETPVEFGSLPRRKVLADFKAKQSSSKLMIMEQWDVDPVPIVRFGSYWDYQIEPIEQDKRVLKPFTLLQYHYGFILRFPTLLAPGKLQPFHDCPKLFATFEEHERWGALLGVSTLGDLNRLIHNNRIKEMMWVAEGLHEKKLSQLADQIGAGFPHRRLVTIAGPSASGKTTFAKRLGIQLRVNGFQTISISMDDYFIDREKIPVDDEGNRDFESISALDLDLLGVRINQLLAGKPVPKRKFDFETGKGYDTNQTVQLKDNCFILLEGIHGLNPLISDMFGKDHLHQIYVSAITQLNIDATHRVSTSDLRLLRRLCRDHKFRGYSPEETLLRWPSVRQGEEKNIFPYQEEANIMFNSSLVYELPVLCSYVKPLLKAVNENGEIANKVLQLTCLLMFLEPLEERLVPGISILREFIGNSEFDY
jgi:uridine kinase